MLFGGQTSDISPGRFFLSPTGRKDPQSELRATIDAVFSEKAGDSPGEAHPRCRFPLRTEWLEEVLSRRAPSARCAGLAEWIGHPSSVDLVFADYDFGNPASAYGHIFLRVNQAGRPEDARLIDVAVGFAAALEGGTSPGFALKALMGGVPGKFSVGPYYLKVKEYSQAQSRDLWEYRLGLSSAAARRLLMHIWELGEAQIPYSFLTRNCAYQLLPLLDVAEPSLGLSHWARLGAAPADVVRFLGRQAGFSGTLFRPSIDSALLMRRARMSKRDRALVDALARMVSGSAISVLETLPSGRQANMLDAAYDLARSRKNGKGLFAAGRYGENIGTLLNLRKKLPSPPAIKNWDTGRASPDAGHGTTAVGALFGGDRHGQFAEVALRPVLHDILAAQEGFQENTQFELLGLRFRAGEGRGVYLQQFDLFNLASVQPWESWLRKHSWRFEVGMRQAEEKNCSGRSCLISVLNGGYGASVQIGESRRTTIFALAEAEFGAGSQLERGWRGGGGGSAGVILKGGPFRALMEFSDRRYPLGDGRQNTLARCGASWTLARDIEIRAALVSRRPHEEYSFGGRISF